MTFNKRQKLGHTEHMGRKTQTNSPGVWQSPPSWRVLVPQEQQRDGRRGTQEVGHPIGGRQTESRVETTEGGARRDLEQEKPGGTQATDMKTTYGRVERGRSHGGGRADDSRGGEQWRWSRSRTSPRSVDPVEREEVTWRSRRDEAQLGELSPDATDGRRLTKAELEGRGSLADLVDWWATMERRELGAMVEPLGQQTEAKSGTQRLEVKTRHPPALTLMEIGRAAVISLHRWWAEGEQRGYQKTAVEEAEAGAGGYLWASELSELVCAAHTNQIVTPSTGNASDRGTRGLADSSGQTGKSEKGGRRKGMSAYISASQSMDPFPFSVFLSSGSRHSWVN